jgi:hypothetical protein
MRGMIERGPVCVGDEGVRGGKKGGPFTGRWEVAMGAGTTEGGG